MAERLQLAPSEAAEIQNLDDALRKLKAEKDENTERLELAPSEAVACAKELKALEQPEAEKRKASGQKAGGRGRKKLGAESAPSLQGKTRLRVAEAVGLSFDTLRKAEVVVDAAQADPSLAPVVEEMDRTGNVNRAACLAPRLRQSAGSSTGRRAAGLMAARQAICPVGPPTLLLRHGAALALRLVRKRVGRWRRRLGRSAKIRLARNW